MTVAPTPDPVTDPPRPGSVIAAATLLFVTAGLFGFAGGVIALLSVALGGVVAGPAVLYLAVTGVGVGPGRADGGALLRQRPVGPRIPDQLMLVLSVPVRPRPH